MYPDPYTGMNLRSIPGTTYPIFEDFSNIPMPPNSPFRQPWWFRTEFKLPTEYSGKSLWLGFDGINYRCQRVDEWRADRLLTAPSVRRKRASADWRPANGNS